MSLDSLLKAASSGGEKGEGIDLQVVYKWMRDNSLHLDPALNEIAQATESVERNQMISSPEQMQFFQILFKLMGVKNVIEVGTYTGFGTLAMSLALPDDGKIITCDITEDYATVGKPFWEKAGQMSKIDLRIGMAKDSLTKVLEEKGEGSFDFAFIDCDKEGYDDYYELCLKLVKKNGLIAVDNTLWSGKVAYERFDDEATRCVRSLVAKMYTDRRIEQVMLPIGDGLTLARVL